MKQAIIIIFSMMTDNEVEREGSVAFWISQSYCALGMS